MTKPNGGPAFPAKEFSHMEARPEGYDRQGFPVNAHRIAHAVVTDHPGMTLRDYFAAKALEGLIAQSHGTAIASNPQMGAGWAYRVADAMIEERSK